MTTPREAVAVCVRSPHQSRQRGPVRSAVDLPDTEIKRGRQHGLRSQGPESCPYTQELVVTISSIEPHEGPDTLIESKFHRTISTKPCSLSSCLAKKRTEHEFWPPGMQTPAVKKIKRTVQNQEITRYVTLLYWMWTHVYCPYARDRHNKKDSLYEKLTEKAIDA